MAADSAPPLHPYFPEGILLSGNNFVPNDWGVATLILAFAAGITVILGITLVVVRKINPRLKLSDQGLILWFVMSGSLHVFFEGYFVYNHARMSIMQDFFGQLWKEYALSDSRYMSSDPIVLCMESLTAITWGPLCFLTAILITRNSQYRHPTQALVSTGHLYGNLIYYTTCLFEDFYSDKRYYRPEPQYFWGYFIFMNAFWLIIPAICLYSSVKASGRAFRLSSKVEDIMSKKKV